MRPFRDSLLFFLFILLSNGAAADDLPRSTMLMGQIGLNNIPSARMDETGTMRVGISTLDPYLHSFAGAQITDWFHIGVRQSAEKSSLLSRHKALYPGLDLKFTVNREGRYDPEVAFGFLSAFGHRKTASEYIALSKRYKTIDVTLGMGWGRLAGDGHIRNPLRRLSSHFDDDRSFTDEEANSIQDWFTGKDVGFFGGIEYHTPLEGLSIKADWGANPYGIEAKTMTGYDKPASWSFALNYAPVPWMDTMLGLQGTDKVMARLSFQDNIASWVARPYKTSAPLSIADKSADSSPAILRDAARAHDIYLGRIKREGDTALSVQLYLQPHMPVAQQIGRAARHIANHAPPEIGMFHITPMRGKIAGQSVQIIRRELELAVLHHRSSPEEMWRNSEIGAVVQTATTRTPFIPDFNLSLENDISLTEDDAEYLYRSALIGRLRADMPFGLYGGLNIKLNIKDNLNDLDPRILDFDVIRSDVDQYTKRRLYLERAYVGWRGQIIPDVFAALTTGAPEEMHLGGGAEILYRPFGKTWAVGAEGWLTYKRDASDIWGLDRIGSPRFSGHLNLYYEIPNTGVTAYAKAGQYLGGDRGGTLGIRHQFDNGVMLDAFATATNEADYDPLGGSSHMHGGLTLRIPLGNIPYIPEGSDVTTRFMPQGRNAGQVLDNPEPLYAVTEPLSFRGASQSWHHLLD